MMFLKVDGIYDIRTINQLVELGVRRFSFDLRPRSLNFIQHYRVIEIISQATIGSDKRFTFHFADEHPMLIQKFIDDLGAQTGINQSDWLNGRVQLEFSGRDDFEALDDFNVPYRWFLHEGADWSQLKRAQNLRGLILPFDYLERAHETGRLHQLCSNLHTSFPNQSFHLARSWDANVFASLLDIFDFEDIALPIDPAVEVCFRNVDPTKLRSGIQSVLVNNQR